MAELQPGNIRFVSVGKQWNAHAEVWSGAEWIVIRGVKSATFKRETDTLDEITIVAACHYWRDD